MTLISMLPGAYVPDLPDGESLPNIPKLFLKSNSSFQADVRLFQEDLAGGRYDPVWLKDAQEAMSKRARGHYDDWKEKNREEFWGQKQKIDWQALAGESSQHKLLTLVAAGCFEVGDIWRLRRSPRGMGIVIEKEAMVSSLCCRMICFGTNGCVQITSIATDNLLSFSFAPREHKFSSPVHGEEVVLVGIDGPTPLADALLKEDGRVVGVRWANTWKDFRCFRKNQDMGSLFDIRELYYSRQ
ncbi:MAG: hypothetical protein ACRYG8_50030 [Janthinobacterium lividum]